MKKISIFLLICFFYGNAFSQSIERNLVGTAGETLAAGGNYLCFSIGEPVILPSPSEVFNPMFRAIMFTIGFQQAHIAQTGSLLHSHYRVSAYPNPTTGWVRLDIHGGFPQTNSVKIYNAAGQEVVFKPYEIVNGKIDLNLSGLPAGMYIVTVTDKVTGNSATTQIIKQNK